MKRYYVFAFPEYYPGGGMADCLGAFDTWDDAVKHATAADAAGAETVQLLDTERNVYFNIGAWVWTHEPQPVEVKSY